MSLQCRTLIRTTPAGMCSLRDSFLLLTAPEIWLWNWNQRLSLGVHLFPLVSWVLFSWKTMTTTCSKLISPELHNEEGRSFLANSSWGRRAGGGETLGGNLIGSVLVTCLPLHQWLQLWEWGSYEWSDLSQVFSAVGQARVRRAKHGSCPRVMEALVGSLNVPPTSGIGANISSARTAVKEE